MIDTEIKIKGFDELDKELALLPIKIQRKIAGKVVREGAKVVQQEAKRLAPRRTKEWEGIKYKQPPGTLKKNIKVRKMLQKHSGRDVVGYTVGLTGKAWYGRLVEFGHKFIRRKKIIGQVPAKPFMRPAFDKTKTQVLARMKAVFLVELGNYKRG